MAGLDKYRAWLGPKVYDQFIASEGKSMDLMFKEGTEGGETADWAPGLARFIHAADENEFKFNVVHELTHELVYRVRESAGADLTEKFKRDLWTHHDIKLFGKQFHL